MDYLPRLVRLFGLLMLGVLCAYWITFVGESLIRLVAGGPHAVLLWYMHLGTEGSLSWRWNGRIFLVQQLVLVVVTLALALAVRGRPLPPPE